MMIFFPSVHLILLYSNILIHIFDLFYSVIGNKTTYFFNFFSFFFPYQRHFQWHTNHMAAKVVKTF